MYIRNHYYDDTREWSVFVVGAFVGAGIALLWAPQPGAKLRQMLSAYANREKGNLLDRAEEAFDKGEEVVPEAGWLQGDLPNRDRRRAGQSIKEFA